MLTLAQWIGKRQRDDMRIHGDALNLIIPIRFDGAHFFAYVTQKHAIIPVGVFISDLSPACHGVIVQHLVNFPFNNLAGVQILFSYKPTQ